MKRSCVIQLLTMGVSVLALTACENAGDGEVAVKHYASVDACAVDGTLERTKCEEAYHQAREGYETAYPKYESRLDCEQDAGDGKCEVARPGTSDKSWRPMMLAFLIPGSRHPSQALVANHASPTRLATATGVALGGSANATTLPRSAAASRPQAADVAKVSTASRGGFGSSGAHASASGGTASHGGG
jgi:uncharacterized protein YgiB involved in biofilm formation